MKCRTKAVSDMARGLLVLRDVVSHGEGECSTAVRTEVQESNERAGFYLRSFGLSVFEPRSARYMLATVSSSGTLSQVFYVHLARQRP